MFAKRIICLVAVLFTASSVFAQINSPKKEVRGIWIATVVNLDWPHTPTLPEGQKQQELVFQLEELKAAGINTVFFQVRTEGDALYDSEIEPWSKYLTGEEGKTPNPYWDPLDFAIKEAHKRGMELHAWINPYRAMRKIPDDFTQKTSPLNVDKKVDNESLKPFLNRYYDASTPKSKLDTQQRDSMHVSNTHPEWLLVLNDAWAIFNPGLPEVRKYNLGIVMDVVNRYDVDGIHFDDYFYPYPPNHMASSEENDALDDSTFAKYPRDFDDKDDWRRDNINMFVQMVYDSIQVVKPWVKFGISPFGIWKNGVPVGTYGMDAYSVIYADAVAWLENHSIDYITPQLYWPFRGGQDYEKLAPWWAEQAADNKRHIYPGLALYRSESSTFSGTLFSADEIPRQVRYNRNNNHISGSVYFRSNNISRHSSKGFHDSLKTNYYKNAALQPTMHWKDTTKPPRPKNLTLDKNPDQENEITLTWERPPVESSLNDSTYVDTLLKYAVYRVDSAEDPAEEAEMGKPENLIEVTGNTNYTDIATPSSEYKYYYFVTAVNRNNVESTPTPSMDAGVIVSNEEHRLIAEEFKLLQNYPNPFNPSTQIRYQLPENSNVQLKVFDMLGRNVATLVHKHQLAGSYSVTFDASKLSSGIYFYQLSTQGISISRKMTLIK